MKKYAFIAVLLMCVCVLRAQSITSYTCDFEDPTENAQWNRNIVASNRDITQCINKWYIGPAGGFGVGSSVSSSSGLYISAGVGADTLVSSYSNSQSVFISAARTLQLAAGTYSVVFDWEAMGSDANDGLYVFWVEGTDTKTNSNWSDRSAVTLPGYVTNSTRYGGALSWRSSAFTFTTAGNGGKLVVLWMNALTPVVEPAGKIDNICVYQGSQCQAPTNVRYDGNTHLISWNGNASSYDVMLYNYNTKSLNTYTDLTTKSIQMPDISEEGYYYIYVRSRCDEGHSVWVYTEKFVWLKGVRCIDIFDLTPDNSGAAKCYWTDRCDYNYAGSSAGYDPYLYDNAGQVLGANGSDSEDSRHVIHYRIGETDPRTDNQLKTIPDGEIASIRVNGFWNTAGDHASTIEYDYPVQAGVSDLLVLKFACVLQNPDHSEDEQPRFKLDILQGNTVVSTCAQKDFKPGFGEAASWHKINEGTYDQVDWCDWQTVTVSLRDYVGSTLKLRLSAYDCTLSGHYGYAYFTLNCMGGDLQGIACGDFSTDHFEAPDGFNYRWYRADDPTKEVLSTDQVFNIAADDPSIYLLDCIDRNNSRCFYTLEANPNPRFPQARAHMQSHVGEECSNKATFTSDCRVVRINRQSLDSVFTDEPVESVVWDFGDGSQPIATLDRHVMHAYPAEGGEFEVTVTASISGGVCEDPHRFIVSLPNITTPDSHDSIHYCEEGTDWNDTTYLQNNTGCEYKSVRHHMFHPRYEASYSDRICEGGRYYFPGDGKYYTSSIDTTLALQSRFGCDSLISLHLIVDPRLEVEYPHLQRACLEDNVIEIPYQIVSGSMDSIKVYFSAEDQARGFDVWYGFANGEDIIIPIPDGIRPDLYNVKIEFGGERCQMDLQSMQLMLTYPTSIVMQNGGFIAVQNDQYNGGHKFNSFVWYRNGELMDTNASYVPTTPTDEGATYVLSLVREGENYAVESCPIVYNPTAQGLNDLSEEVLVWPTAVQAGANLWIAPSKGCTIYSVLGTEVIRYPQSDIVRTVSAPTQPGMYLVVFDNHQSATIIVR